MGSFPANCEIIESAEESKESKPKSSGSGVDDGHRRLPALKLKCNSSLEDDLNHLFEAINLKASTRRLSHQDGSGTSRRDKKPISVGPLYSPQHEISQPVTLKQALRGLCISQASEMAAMRRLSKSRPSESGIKKYTSSGLSFEEAKKNLVETPRVLQASTSNSTEKMPQYLRPPKMKMAGESSHSSPRFAIITTPKVIVPESTEVMSRTSEAQPVLKEIKSEVVKVVPSSVKSANKAAVPKPSRKGRLQTGPSSSSSNSTNGTKLRKTTRSATRLVKPVIRTKNFIKKKQKQETTSASRVSKTFVEVNSSSDPVAGGQLLCQSCKCTLKNVLREPMDDSPPSISKKDSLAEGRVVVVKADKNSKSREKGEFSQSSKSSIGEHSSSTSISEESNLSGSSCGNRPHMSKDLKWDAIRSVQMQYGVLGLGHFNLLEKLGCGDIGTVYLAELVGTECQFALKVMDNEYLARRKKMPRAQTEREILRMLDHPFLPTLYAQFTSDNLSCLVMEYCPHGDLHVLRQKQPGRNFPEQAARFYVAEVLLALEYLHMLGVVYRDLKPENILVRGDGHIMLTDFDLSLRCSVNPTLLKSPLTEEPRKMSGPCAESSCVDPFCIEPRCEVSCFTPRMTRRPKPDPSAHIKSLPQLVAEPTSARSNSFVGTHEYLAPEIIKGEGHGSAVDWWTFGIFLYELLYGKTPFKGCGNEETLANVVMQSLVFPDTPLVSFQARDLIRGLLVKEPEYRLGSERGAAEIKQHPFFEGLNWALIRCAVPPEPPKSCDFRFRSVASGVKDDKYLEFQANGEKVEFELF